MRGALRKPLDQSSIPVSAGPELVPPAKAYPAENRGESIAERDANPFTTILIVAVVAFTLAFGFFSTVMMWVWFRNTGVNWMFQRS